MDQLFTHYRQICILFCSLSVCHVIIWGNSMHSLVFHCAENVCSAHIRLRNTHISATITRELALPRAIESPAVLYNPLIDGTSAVTKSVAMASVCASIAAWLGHRVSDSESARIRHHLWVRLDPRPEPPPGASKLWPNTPIPTEHRPASTRPNIPRSDDCAC